MKKPLTEGTVPFNNRKGELLFSENQYRIPTIYIESCRIGGNRALQNNPPIHTPQYHRHAVVVTIIGLQIRTFATDWKSRPLFSCEYGRALHTTCR